MLEQRMHLSNQKKKVRLPTSVSFTDQQKTLACDDTEANLSNLSLTVLVAMLNANSMPNGKMLTNVVYLPLCKDQPENVGKKVWRA